MTDYLVFIPIGYMLGSLPFGLIAGRLVKGVDVRKYGSGMTGMTNVLRTIGIPAAITVLALDMGKAVLAVVLTRIFTDSTSVETATAVAAILGHNYPVFSGLKGGRGTATGWGGLFILSPIAGVIASVIGLSTVAIWRFVSLGSVLGATLGAVTLVALSLLGVEPLAYAWYGMIGLALIVVKHKDNIARLIKGEERRLGQPVKEVAH